MDLGDRIIVSEKRHPFYMFSGTVIGKRGFRIPGDPMLLILINERQRSYLIPESMVSLQQENDHPVKLS